MGIVEENIADKNKALSAATSLATEERNLRDRLQQVEEGKADYAAFQERSKNPGLFIDSQAVRDLFHEYKTRFLLNKISLEMQPIVDFTADPKYTKKEFVTTKTIVKVTVETASDEDVYHLISALYKDLPGYIRITNFAISKMKDLSKESVDNIRKIGTDSLVKTEFSFDWFGLRSTEKDSAFNQYISKKKDEQVP